MTHDETYMQQALAAARAAAQQGDIPVGAVIVDAYNQVLAVTHNHVESTQDPTAHAELLAISQAARARADWRLTDCTLYVTLQPCYMCWASCALARINRVVYAAPSPVYGYDPDMAGVNIPRAYRDWLRHIEQGPLSAVAQELLQEFFRTQRASSHQV